MRYGDDSVKLQLCITFFQRHLTTVWKTGQYCETSGLDSPTGDCEAGFFCPNGSKVANPTNNVCPKGLFWSFGFFVSCGFVLIIIFYENSMSLHLWWLGWENVMILEEA